MLPYDIQDQQPDFPLQLSYFPVSSGRQVLPVTVSTVYDIKFRVLSCCCDKLCTYQNAESPTRASC
jgi:hypothetical protein